MSFGGNESIMLKAKQLCHSHDFFAMIWAEMANLLLMQNKREWYREFLVRNHGLLNIAASDFFETGILIPSNIEEQTKIGDFFYRTRLSPHPSSV